MKYGRKKEFVDAEIEARMGISNINAIADTAKADPTVDNSLLGDKGGTVKPTMAPASAVPAAAKAAPPVDPTKPMTQKVAAEKAAIAALPKAPLPVVADKVPEPDIKVQVKPAPPVAPVVPTVQAKIKQ